MKVDPDLGEGDGEGDEEDADADDDEEEGAGVLREAGAPLGPPVGADAESTRLSETVSVGMPSEGEKAVVGLVAVVPVEDACCERGTVPLFGRNITE